MRRAAWLLPLLIIYTFIVIFYAIDGHDLRVDERRYTRIGETLARGGYPAGREPGLWSGPGYSIILIPFAMLGIPWIIPRLVNGVFLFLGLVYLYHLAARYVPRRWAYIAVYCVGLYPIMLKYMPRLMTEQVSILLVCGFAFHFARVCRREEGRVVNMVIAAAFLGWLALTKVLFGYVIAACIIVYAVSLILTRRRTVMRTLVIYCMAMLFCVPYLLYTHSRTGKTFYWASSGGLSLYWMSNPHEKEYGDWLGGHMSFKEREKAKNHLEFLNSLSDMTATEKDDALKEQAIRNIVNHPAKFVNNWGANLGRLFCDYPYSYTRQFPKNYSKLIPGILLLLLSAFSMVPAYSGRRSTPYEIQSLFIFGLVYVGASSLLSAYNRMLIPVLPLFALWICFMIHRFLDSQRRA